MKQFFEKLRVNLPVRMQNIWFWVGLLGAVLSAMGASPEMFTSWGLVWEEFVAVVSNPFRLGCVTLAVIGVLTDPTTPGIGDSAQALTYRRSKK